MQAARGGYRSRNRESTCHVGPIRIGARIHVALRATAQRDTMVPGGSTLASLIRVGANHTGVAGDRGDEVAANNMGRSRVASCHKFGDANGRAEALRTQ